VTAETKETTLNGEATAVPSSSHCSTRSAKREHNPARHKLPKVLRDLPWRTMDANRMWCDCDRILAAVPVCDRSSDPNGAWHYEMAIVTVRCDEGYFATEVEGSPWGWEIDDIDFYVLLTGSA